MYALLSVRYGTHPSQRSQAHNCCPLLQLTVYVDFWHVLKLQNTPVASSQESSPRVSRSHMTNEARLSVYLKTPLVPQMFLVLLILLSSRSRWPKSWGHLLPCGSRCGVLYSYIFLAMFCAWFCRPNARVYETGRGETPAHDVFYCLAVFIRLSHVILDSTGDLCFQVFSVTVD